MTPSSGLNSIASCGVEPLFDTRFSRRILNEDMEYETFELEDYAFRKWREFAGERANPPRRFVKAQGWPTPIRGARAKDFMSVLATTMTRLC